MYVVCGGTLPRDLAFTTIFDAFYQFNPRSAKNNDEIRILPDLFRLNEPENSQPFKDAKKFSISLRYGILYCTVPLLFD